MATKSHGTFGLIVRFTVKQGNEEAFDRMTAETVSKVQQNEPGTLLYISHQVEGAPTERMFYELYQDRAAFEAHEAQPYVKEFLAGREALLDATQVDFLTPTSRATTTSL